MRLRPCSAKQYLELGPSLTFFECFCDLRSQVYRIDHYLAKNMVPWLPSIQTSSDSASGGGMYCTCIILNHSKSIPHPQVPRPSTSHVLAMRCWIFWHYASPIVSWADSSMHLGHQAMWVTDLMFKPNPLVQRAVLAILPSLFAGRVAKFCQWMEGMGSRGRQC